MTGYDASKENRDVRNFRKLFPYLKMTLMARYAGVQEAERFLKKSLRGVSHLSKIGLRVRPSVEGEGRVWKGDRLPGEGIKRRPVIPSHSEESR